MACHPATGKWAHVARAWSIPPGPCQWLDVAASLLLGASALQRRTLQATRARDRGRWQAPFDGLEAHCGCGACRPLTIGVMGANRPPSQGGSRTVWVVPSLKLLPPGQKNDYWSQPAPLALARVWPRNSGSEFDTNLSLALACSVYLSGSIILDRVCNLKFDWARHFKLFFQMRDDSENDPALPQLRSGLSVAPCNFELQV